MNPNVLKKEVGIPPLPAKDIPALIAFLLFIAAFVIFIHEINDVEAFKIASSNWKVILLLWLALMVVKLRFFFSEKETKVS